MSIATAITNAQNKVANCYTAISNKGGTLPQTQDLSNMPTAINSIPTGGSPTLITKTITANGTYNASSDNADGYSSVTVNVSGGSKYGCTIDNFLVDNGTTVLQSDFSNVDIVLPNPITSIDSRAFSYKFYFLLSKAPKSFSAPNVITVNARAFEYAFYQCEGLLSASFPSLKTISNIYAFNEAFELSGITDANFSELETISANNVFANAWSSCRLNSINFSKLKTISGDSVFYFAFSANNAITGAYLTTASFPLLDYISGTGTFYGAFNRRINLSSLSFPSLKTTSFGSNVNQFNGMFNSYTGSTATGGCTVHFPSNMQSTIAGLTGYPNFGGTSGYVTLAFDLPATS